MITEIYCFQTILLNLGGCEGAHTLTCNHILECLRKTVLISFKGIYKTVFAVHAYLGPIQVTVRILHLIIIST